MWGVLTGDIGRLLGGTLIVLTGAVGTVYVLHGAKASKNETSRHLGTAFGLQVCGMLYRRVDKGSDILCLDITHTTDNDNNYAFRLEPPSEAGTTPPESGVRLGYLKCIHFVFFTFLLVTLNLSSFSHSFTIPFLFAYQTPQPTLQDSRLLPGVRALLCDSVHQRRRTVLSGILGDADGMDRGRSCATIWSSTTQRVIPLSSG
jgi:hypothetical protein